MATFRTYGPRFNPGSLLTPAIKALLIANTAVFLLQTLAKLFSQEGSRLIIEWFALIPLAATQALRIWQPFTYMFLHGDLMHLLVNMFVLWMFGRDLEGSWGKRRFLKYYFITGVGAGVVNIVVKLLTGGADSATIGASGAIYGILMACAVLYPDRQIWLIPFPLMLPMRVYVTIIGAIAFFGSLGSSGDNVSHISHLSGMIVGYIYLRRGSFLFRFRNQISDWRRARARRKFEVYMRDQEKKEPPSRPDNWVN